MLEEHWLQMYLQDWMLIHYPVKTESISVLFLTWNWNWSGGMGGRSTRFWHPAYVGAI